MADFSFSQPERRSFLVPAILALVVIGGALALVFSLTPHHIAELTVLHTAIVPEHIDFGSASRVVGQTQSEDDLYVLVTVRVTDKLNIPIYIKDLTGTLTSAEGAASTTSAVEKNDIAPLFVTFPAIKPLAGPPLLRDTEIDPGQSVEGMVLLRFPTTQAVWDARQSATVSVDLRNQGPQTVTIPKP